MIKFKAIKLSKFIYMLTSNLCIALLENIQISIMVLEFDGVIAEHIVRIGDLGFSLVDQCRPTAAIFGAQGLSKITSNRIDIIGLGRLRDDQVTDE